jgi:hypothetical protein
VVARDGASVRDRSSSWPGGEVDPGRVAVAGSLCLLALAVGLGALAGGQYLVAVTFWVGVVAVFASAFGVVLASGDPAADGDDDRGETATAPRAGDREAEFEDAGDPGEGATGTDDAPAADDDRFGSPFDDE